MGSCITVNRIKVVVLESEMLFEASLKLAHYNEENEHQYSRAINNKVYAQADTCVCQLINLPEGKFLKKVKKVKLSL
jgi:hypothetical protein